MIPFLLGLVKLLFLQDYGNTVGCNDSPYEANFTNLLCNSKKQAPFISANIPEYCMKANNLFTGIDQYPPEELSMLFEEAFSPESLTSLQKRNIFAEQLVYNGI